MDATARERFGHHLTAMSQSVTNLETWEHRQQAEAIAKGHGWTFDQALRAHRAGWPTDEADRDEHEDGAETPSSGRSDAIAREVSSNVVIGDAVDEAEVGEAHLSTEGVELPTVVATALAADPSRSDRDIAREAGCSPTTVGRARAAAGLTRLVRSVRRGGKTYEMATGERGSS